MSDQESGGQSTSLIKIPEDSLIDLDDLIDKEMDAKIKKAVLLVLQGDQRLSSEPEVVQAIADYIRLEVVSQILFKKIVINDFDSNDEKLFKGVMNMKNILRDEIWGTLKGRKKKDTEIDHVESVLIDQKIIEAKIEVDPLAKSK